MNETIPGEENAPATARNAAERAVMEQYERYLHGLGRFPSLRRGMDPRRYGQLLDAVNTRLGRPLLRGRLPGRNPEDVSLSACERTEDGAYILPAGLDIDGAELRADDDRPIWSVGQDASGQRFAATDDRYYQREGFACVWLR